jgi:TetR/AcrR family transcriptional regulator
MKGPRKSKATGYSTAVFAALPVERQRRVLAAARSVFARDGFAGANVNEIAERAGVSVGALYKYFRTKKDLFLALVEQIHDRLEEGLAAIEAAPGTLFEKIRMVFTAGIEGAQAERELVQIYIACMTQELAPMAGQLSRRIEERAARTYRRMLAEARSRGEISAAVDPALEAFCFDNVIIGLQFAYASRYYRERLRIFVGSGRAGRQEEIVDGMVAFLRRAFGAPPAQRKRRGR